jgi:hypothetical protein
MVKSDKRLCIKLSKSMLEKFLFQDKVKIYYIETDPSTQDIAIYLDGAGLTTSEGCHIACLTLEQALSEIKRTIKECQMQD